MNGNGIAEDFLNALKSSDYNRACKIANDTQLQPTVLDPVLAESVELLCRQDQLEPIYILCKTRGWKVVSHFLSSDVYLLEPLLAAIDNTDSWQARYVRLLWLAVVVLAPFSLDKWGPNIYDRIFSVATRYVGVSGKERDASAVLLARLISRDRAVETERVAEFTEWALESYSSPGTPEFQRLGVLQTVAALASTVDLGPVINKLGVIAPTEDTLESKLRLKILGRTALRGLDPDFIEFVVAECVASLGHVSSSVRMSAAKYLARLASNLMNTGNEEMAGEVGDAVLDIFDEDLTEGVDEEDWLLGVSDERWQGALLAAAEFIRHAVSLDLERLCAVLPSALHFTQRRFRVSAGGSVRDSACYVCWALFRSQCPISEYSRLRIYASMTALACFDRQINVRRAAAAAIQEGFGRQGSGEKELEFVQKVNFQSVSLLSRCYLEIGPRVNADPRYLILHGVCSFDPEMRRLAARSAPLYASLDRQKLRKLAMSRDPDFRHGGLLALAALGDSCTFEPVNFASDLDCEAALRQLAVLRPQTDANSELVALCMRSEEPFVEAAARDFAMARATPRHIQEWESRMRDSSTYVAAIVSAPTLVAPELVLVAAKLPSARSRSYAIQALHPNSAEQWAQFLNAMEDYQSTERGDVGSFVREAAVMRVPDLWPIASEEWKRVAESRMWRLATDKSEKLRVAASEVLRTIGVANLPSQESSKSYFQEALEQSETRPKLARIGVIEGITASVGATRARRDTSRAVLEAVTDYARTSAGSTQAILDAILSLDRQRVPEVLTALERLVAIFGVPGTQKESHKLLAVAFNTTVQSRDPRNIEAAVQLLGWLCKDHRKAIDRLIKLCTQHPSAGIRMRAAEALVEAGYTSDLLEDTEWQRMSRPSLQELQVALDKW